MFHSTLSGKKKICLDNNVLSYDKSDSTYYSYKFSLDGHKFEITQIDEDRYDLKIDGLSYKSLMSDERNGRLDKTREIRESGENIQREIDEYNKRDNEINQIKNIMMLGIK